MGVKNILKKVIGGIAPTIATALGGPMAGAAVNAIAEKLDIAPQSDVADTEQAIVDALESGSPTVWAQVKRAEQDFKVQLKQLDIDLEKVHQEDRASARERQVALKDKAPGILAAVIMGIFTMVLVFQFMIVFRQIIIDPSSMRVLDASLGILSAAVVSVVSYYFGSSVGSKRKTELMGNSK